jgi:hypothetical protein
MARSLDDQALNHPRPLPSPGFVQPSWQPWSPPSQQPVAYPPPPQSFPSPSPLPLPLDDRDPLATTMASLSLSNTHPRHRTPSASSYVNQQRDPASPPSLISPLPSIPNLAAALPTIQKSSHDPALKVTWARDVFFLVDRLQQNPGPDGPVGPAYIPDEILARLVQTAVPLVLQIANPQPMPNPIPRHVAEAIYLRATFAASGAYPEFVQVNPRFAFRDFELSARAGYAPAWFRLGRDYENVKDVSHARECFEQGAKLGVESCIYVNIHFTLGLVFHV